MKSRINTRVERFLQLNPEISTNNERKFGYVFHPNSFERFTLNRTFAGVQQKPQNPDGKRGAE